jgi:hypothetical protein
MTDKSIWTRFREMLQGTPEEPASTEPAKPATDAAKRPAAAKTQEAATGQKPAAHQPLQGGEWKRPAEKAPAKPSAKPATGSATSSLGSAAAPMRTSATPRPEPVNLPEHVRVRIRERYFKTRFPDVPVPSPGSSDCSAIVKAARLYFEDGDTGRAVELLRLSSEMMPRVERILLAKLEIHYLDHNETAFTETARTFAERFPGSSEWPAVARLGWRLAPNEALFANARPAKVARDEQYGAWPEVPNWIEAPWDLTGEVLAVELRGRILATGRSGGTPSQGSMT